MRARRRWVSGLALAATALGAAAVATVAPLSLAAPALKPPKRRCLGPQILLFSNWNVNAVRNGGAPPVFTTHGRSYCIVAIDTYHWNNGLGATPGTIALVGHQGRLGPWKAFGTTGSASPVFPAGVPNANWTVQPGTPAKPVIINGVYACDDSDPATWSQDSASAARGFCKIYVRRAAKGAGGPGGGGGGGGGKKACSLPKGAPKPHPLPCADLAVRAQALGWPQFAGLGVVFARAKRLGAGTVAALRARLRKLARPLKVFGVGQLIELDVTVSNNGDNAGRCDERTLALAPPVLSVPCAPGPIAAGGSWTNGWLVALLPGAYKYIWGLFKETVFDPVLANNSTALSVTVFRSQSAIVARPSRKRFHGGLGPLPALDAQAPPPRRTGSPNPALEQTAQVDVAVLRTGGSACLWLSDAAGHFSVRPAFESICAEPIWLRASGTTSWQYNLSQPLPAGSYALYVRVVNRAGTAEDNYSPANGNVVTFTVP